MHRCTTSRAKMSSGRSGQYITRPAIQLWSPKHTRARFRYRPAHKRVGWWQPEWTWEQWWRWTAPTSPWGKEFRAVTRSLPLQVAELAVLVAPCRIGPVFPPDCD